MSTNLHLRCVTHDPYIASEEVGHNESYLPVVRNAVMVKREEITTMVRNMMEDPNMYTWPDFGSSAVNNLYMFLWRHPHCDLELWNEYGDQYSWEEGPAEEPIGKDTVLGKVEVVQAVGDDGMIVRFSNITHQGRRVIERMGSMKAMSLFSKEQDDIQG